MASFMRILVLTTILAGVVATVVYRDWLMEERRLRAAVSEAEARMQLQIEAKQQMIDRLGRSRRVAHIEILDQEFQGEKQQPESTTLRFIELGDDGGELARQDVTIPGDIMFIDAWTARFPTEDIANNHPMRGKTLILLRRIYSDRMEPRHGTPIDTPGSIPSGYAATEPARYERAIWSRFWDIATDAETAAGMGVRVAQGEAVYKPVRKGEQYQLVVESQGGMTLAPLSSDASPESLSSATATESVLQSTR